MSNNVQSNSFGITTYVNSVYDKLVDIQTSLFALETNKVDKKVSIGGDAVTSYPNKLVFGTTNSTDVDMICENTPSIVLSANDNVYLPKKKLYLGDAVVDPILGNASIELDTNKDLAITCSDGNVLIATNSLVPTKDVVLSATDSVVLNGDTSIVFQHSNVQSAALNNTELLLNNNALRFGTVDGPRIQHTGNNFNIDTVGQHDLNLRVQGNKGVTMSMSGNDINVTTVTTGNGTPQFRANSRGTDARPQYSFVDGTDDGMLLDDNGDLAFSKDATRALTVNRTGDNINITASSPATGTPQIRASGRGTDARPQYSFVDKQGDGMSVDASGSLTFAKDGARALTIGKSGNDLNITTSTASGGTPQFRANARGTAGRPQYSFADEPDTGMYLDSGGNLCISKDGNELFKAGTSGMDIQGKQILFNTVAPGSNPQIVFDNTGSRDTGILSPGDGIIQFKNNGTDCFEFSNAGLRFNNPTGLGAEIRWDADTSIRSIADGQIMFKNNNENNVSFFPGGMSFQKNGAGIYFDQPNSTIRMQQANSSIDFGGTTTGDLSIKWDGDTGLWSGQDGLIRFRNNNNETLHITDNLLSHRNAHRTDQTHLSLGSDFPSFMSHYRTLAVQLRMEDFGDLVYIYDIQPVFFYTRIGNVVRICSSGSFLPPVNAAVDYLEMSFTLPHTYVSLFESEVSTGIFNTNLCGTFTVNQIQYTAPGNCRVFAGKVSIVNASTRAVKCVAHNISSMGAFSRPPLINYTIDMTYLIG